MNLETSSQTCIPLQIEIKSNSVPSKTLKNEKFSSTEHFLRSHKTFKCFRSGGSSKMKILENLPLFASSACKAIKALLLWQRLHLESTMTTFSPTGARLLSRSLWLSKRRHILNFNLALFILFGFIFSASGLPHFEQ